MGAATSKQRWGRPLTVDLCQSQCSELNYSGLKSKEGEALQMKRAAIVALLLSSVFAPFSSQAADMDGAWANDASVCGKVFTKANNRILFAPDSELYGGGLIIEGKRARGSFQKCDIRSMKDDGASVRLTASCSTGVMASDTQATIKVIGKDQITFSLAGPVNTETPLVRCSM